MSCSCNVNTTKEALNITNNLQEQMSNISFIGVVISVCLVAGAIFLILRLTNFGGYNEYE